MNATATGVSADVTVRSAGSLSADVTVAQLGGGRSRQWITTKLLNCI